MTTVDLRQMSIKDQEKLHWCPRSQHYNTHKIKKIQNVLSTMDGSAINRIAFLKCKSEEVPYKYPDNNVCILNFANQESPGVTFPNNSTTQEEELLRKFPGLFKSLKESNFYPIDSDEGGVIITDYAQRFRADDYSVLSEDNRVKCMFVTAAAPDHKEYDFNEKILLQHIRNIVLSPIAFRNGKNRPDMLVIGAWGCGVFCPTQAFYEKRIIPKLSKHFTKCKCYAELIAMMFRTVLIDEQMYKYYDKIVIAIPDKLNLRHFIREFT